MPAGPARILGELDTCVLVTSSWRQRASEATLFERAREVSLQCILLMREVDAETLGISGSREAAPLQPRLSKTVCRCFHYNLKLLPGHFVAALHYSNVKQIVSQASTTIEVRTKERRLDAKNWGTTLSRRGDCCKHWRTPLVSFCTKTQDCIREINDLLRCRMSYYDTSKL